MKSKEIIQTADTLFSAFSDYPLYQYLFNFDPAKIKRHFKFLLRCNQKQIIIVEQNGILIMTKPGENPYTWGNMIKSGLIGNVIFNGIQTMLRIQEMNEFKQVLKNRFLSKSHYIIDILGVDNSFQGSGIGSKLVKKALSIVDGPIYLETSNKDNIEFYSRFGFHLINSAKYKDVPIFSLEYPAQK